MTKTEVPYKKSAQFPCKKTVSLTKEVDDMWNQLSQIHKVAVVEALRPKIDEIVKDLFILHAK